MPRAYSEQDLVVETGPAGLVLGDDLRLEAAVAVAGDFNRQFAEFALQRLPGFAVTGVARGVGNRLVPGVAQVSGHFGFESPFHQAFGELL